MGGFFRKFLTKRVEIQNSDVDFLSPMVWVNGMGLGIGELWKVWVSKLRLVVKEEKKVFNWTRCATVARQWTGDGAKTSNGKIQSSVARHVLENKKLYSQIWPSIPGLRLQRKFLLLRLPVDTTRHKATINGSNWLACEIQQCLSLFEGNVGDRTPSSSEGLRLDTLFSLSSFSPL